MTRFARAKGSKASNERIPENATSWKEMKQQLSEKNKETDVAKKRQEAEEKRTQNYKAFLEEVEEEKTRNSKWAEFPTQNTKKVNPGGIQKGNKKMSIIGKKIVEVAQNGENKNEVAVENKQKKKNKRKLGKMLQDSTEGEKTEIDKAVPKKKKVQKPTNEVKEVEENGENNNKAAVQNKQKKKNRRKVKKLSQDSSAGEKPENDNTKSENKIKADETLQKKNPKSPKIQAQKKVLKQNLQEKTDKPKPEKPETEEDLKKVEKKKEKKLRQLENKKLMKEKVLNSTHSKTKLRKFTKQQKPERRKVFQDSMIYNGKEIAIDYIDGFPIKKEDADRIRQLRKDMIAKGLPRSEIRTSLKLERRKAEKSFSREKKKVCFNCRKAGHNLSECPEIGNELAQSAGTGICFKCGSTEHTHFECKVVKGQEFKFAQCFVCKEQGHIARQCPDNARGLYPNGGACKVCGDVTHLKKDCPKYQIQQQQLEQSLQLDTISSNVNPDSLGNDEFVKTKESKPINKVIKF